MAYKIEDINWDKMPEGATHFRLETRLDLFAWCRQSYDLEIYVAGFGWDKPNYFHLYRYKSCMLVSKYHPEMIAKREAETACKAVQGFVGHILNKHKLMLAAYSGEAHRAADDYCKLIMEGKV